MSPQTLRQPQRRADTSGSGFSVHRIQRRICGGMIGSALALVAVLISGVRSLPVASGQLESEDVKVMKCIVEALADVLSRPRPLPVSEDCLLTLRSDGRLVTILRHHRFLKELQDVALEGNENRAPEDSAVRQTEGTPELRRSSADRCPSVNEAPPLPDRSMLESLGGPGERSILAPEPRGEEGEEARAPDPPPRDEAVKRSQHQEAPRRGGQDRKGSEGSEKRESVKKKSTEEFEEQTREDLKRNGLKLWSKRAKAAPVKKEAETRGDEEVPHHSKEVSNQEVDAERRSPEEEELQLIARTTEEREDEGSGSKKLDIESLATIESELENVAQKLHELSRTDRGQQHA